MANVFDLETVDALPADRQRLVPPRMDRELVQNGDLVRLAVMVNGERFIYPWVVVIECSTRGRYHGRVSGVMNSPDWKPYGSVVEFGPENIIDCDR